MSVCAGIKWVHQQCLLFILGKIQGRIMGFFAENFIKMKEIGPRGAAMRTRNFTM